MVYVELCSVDDEEKVVNTYWHYNPMSSLAMGTGHRKWNTTAPQPWHSQRLGPEVCLVDMIQSVH